MQDVLATRFKRLLELERRVLANEVELRPDMPERIEIANPCFAERHFESSRPAEMLCQDTLFVCGNSREGKIYLHPVIAPNVFATALTNATGCGTLPTNN